MSTSHKSLIRSTKLTAPQRKQLESVQKQINANYQVVLATAPDQAAWEVVHGNLHALRDKAYDAMVANFCPDTAEKFHHAELRLRDAEITGSIIATASNEISQRLSASLRPIVDDVLDRAAASVKKHVADALASLDESNPFQDRRSIQANASQWLAGVESERQHSHDCLDWLQRNLDLDVE